MNKIYKINFISIFLLIYIYYNEIQFSELYDSNFLNSINNTENNEMSIIININNFTRTKFDLYNEIMNKLNSTRKFIFIKTNKNSLDEKINYLVGNTSIKIIQSNFPDSIFLPFVISLYGNTNPKFVLFIDDEELIDLNINNFVNWVDNAIKDIIINKYDYIFGNYKLINGSQIGSSILLSKASIIQHFLYYTNCNTKHINPFIQFSFAKKTKFKFIPFYSNNSFILDNINGIFSSNMECPSFNDDKDKHSLCILLPTFKRNYIYHSLLSLSNQSYKPSFNVIVQNDNRINFNLSHIQDIVKEKVYHIWMQNWNSYFYLIHRIASVLPCDYVLKYDDDQWPLDKTIHERLIKEVKNKNIIIAHRGYSIKKTFLKYTHFFMKNLDKNILDHAATPMIVRPGYFKLDARNMIYRLYSTEDIALSLNSWIFCRVSSIRTKMNLFEIHNDGNNQRADKEINSYYENEKYKRNNIFFNTYIYLILAGYIPQKWDKFKISKTHYINITLKHERLN